jgi:HAD superfamily hydrolase (TIGR01509 family)
LIRAVIFDFDGLLADTETLHSETFAAVLAEEGIVLPCDDEGRRFLGISDAGCFDLVLRERGRDAAPGEIERLVERKSRLYQESAASVRLFEGARELIGETLARHPATIASCGRRSDIAAVLDRHGLASRFPRFVSADDIRRSKPDPECYLCACELLRRTSLPDLEPAQCLVFEDSFRGVEAARRAGMLCAAVTHTCPAALLSDADWVLERLADWRWPNVGGAEGPEGP